MAYFLSHLCNAIMPSCRNSSGDLCSSVNVAISMLSTSSLLRATFVSIVVQFTSDWCVQWGFPNHSFQYSPLWKWKNQPTSPAKSTAELSTYYAVELRRGSEPAKGPGSWWRTRGSLTRCGATYCISLRKTETRAKRESEFDQVSARLLMEVEVSSCLLDA